MNKGTRFYNKGCYRHALQQFQESHERYAAADYLPGIAASLNSLANTYFRLNDPSGAVEVYAEAIEIYRLLDDEPGLIRALVSQSAALMAAGQLDAASNVLEKADKMADKQRIHAGRRLKTRAMLLMQRQDYPAAEKLMVQALKATPSDDQAQAASVRYALGRVLINTQGCAQALPYFEAALEADRAVAAYHGIAQDLEALGDCHGQMGQHLEAVTYYKRGLKVLTLLHDQSRVEALRMKLVDSARSAGADIQATLQWVDRWQAGEREANICR